MKIFLATVATIILCTTVCMAQRTFNFKIDQHDYSTDENILNDMFGNAFNELINNHWTDNNNFELWVKSYNAWKDESTKGIWLWETYGDRVAKYSFQGNMPSEYLGWTKPGKDASGNPNKKGNISRRMQLLNIYMSKQIIYYFTHKVIIN